MSELAPPMRSGVRAWRRHHRLLELFAQRNRLELQVRAELVALADEDTDVATRAFVKDELALALSESAGTCGRWLDDARMMLDFPRVVALVADGTWSVRHADAVLGELVGVPDALQQQVLELVVRDADARTPHQLRQAVRAALMVEGLERDRDKQDRIHAGRDVQLREEHDGSALLGIGGTKSAGAEMLAAIDAHVAVAEPGDTRSLGQRRYDFVRDLLSGRVQVSAPWQALIVVSLSTLEGDDEPAHVPGLGLVSAAEAREVLAKADLRRAVVDEHGVLHALDDVVHTGDQQPLGHRLPEPVSHEVEPAPVDDDPGDVSEADASEERLLSWSTAGISRLEDHLRAALLPVLCGGHGPPDGSRGAGPPPDVPAPDDALDPDPHPEPEPSWAERDWLAWQEDRAGVHDQLDRMAHAAASCVLPAPRSTLPCPSLRVAQWREERLERQARASRWSDEALQQAVVQLRTAPLTPVPAASRGYLFRGRLARWIRARDVTCTFPGCVRLARHCQLDHVEAYPVGPTGACNGACECVHHHQCKHAAMTVSRLADGTMRWRTRFDVTVDRPPRPLLRPW